MVLYAKLISLVLIFMSVFLLTIAIAVPPLKCVWIGVQWEKVVDADSNLVAYNAAGLITGLVILIPSLFFLFSL